jgi:hypothetical protein
MIKEIAEPSKLTLRDMLSMNRIIGDVEIIIIGVDKKVFTVKLRAVCSIEDQYLFCQKFCKFTARHKIPVSPL